MASSECIIGSIFLFKFRFAFLIINCNTVVQHGGARMWGTCNVLIIRVQLLVSLHSTLMEICYKISPCYGTKKINISFSLTGL